MLPSMRRSMFSDIHGTLPVSLGIQYPTLEGQSIFSDVLRTLRTVIVNFLFWPPHSKMSKAGERRGECPRWGRCRTRTWEAGSDSCENRCRTESGNFGHRTCADLRLRPLPKPAETDTSLYLMLSMPKSIYNRVRVMR